jgi:large subunit ribosomal protein L13
MVCNAGSQPASQPGPSRHHLRPFRRSAVFRQSRQRNPLPLARTDITTTTTIAQYRNITAQQQIPTTTNITYPHTLLPSNPCALEGKRLPPPCRNSSDRYIPYHAHNSIPSSNTYTLQTRLAYSRAWHLVDAGTDPRPLGRLASSIALTLMGKHKPIYDPSTDCGDYVVCTGLSQLHTTGKKMQKKKYYSHTTRPGSLKEITMERMMEKWGGGEILRRAVRGMLPKNRLRDDRMARLKCEFYYCVGLQAATGRTFGLTVLHDRLRGRRTSLQAEYSPTG